MKPFVLLAGILAVTTLSSCGAPKKPEAVIKEAMKNDKPDDYKVTANTSSVSLNDEKNFTEPRVYDRSNFGLHAHTAGNILIISARNKSDLEIGVSPQDLAIITGADRRNDLIRISPGSADLTQFSGVVLKGNDRAVIRLPMKVEIPKGSRLVYNNPRQTIQFYVEIE